MKLLPTLLTAAALALSTTALSPSSPPPTTNKRNPITYNPPTWDNASLLLLGERFLLFGGEVHPFRLPVPSLWHDVLEKTKALGLNTVSFSVPWALLEGKPGEFRAEGVFDVGKFMEVAREVGVWLVARPGPYINGEVTGGGLPGWIQRLKGHPRTADVDYLAATDNYAAKIGAIIAKAQINNGGKVILYQPESEYSVSRTLIGFNFPDPGYMQYVEDQARRAGVVVPFINNDAWNAGHNAPGTGVGEVDIYGQDLYPLDINCDDMAWDKGSLRDSLYSSHLNTSPSTPYAMPEFQGGVVDYWGGSGFARCAERFNHEQSRVFYKNNFAAGVKIFNLYMIYGGTNWGNLGYDRGYTSYDYAAAIAEDRTIAREKYSELKLQAQFFKVSPGYLEATPDLKPTPGFYSPNQEITVTAVVGPEGSFYVTRKTAYKDPGPVSYTLKLPTSKGVITIPHLGGTLTMPGRDTRIHVTDYPVGDTTLVYCTGEVFTWQEYEGQTILVVYGGMGETHELLMKRTALGMFTKTSPGVKTKQDGQHLYAQWKTTEDEEQFIRAGNLYIYLIAREAAYNFWVTDLPGHSPLIIRGGYLVRSAKLDSDGTLAIRADFNRSTAIDLPRGVNTALLEIMGVPRSAKSVTINSHPTTHTLNTAPNGNNHWLVRTDFQPPSITLPDLPTLPWRYLNTLPELSPSYTDDHLWPLANHTTTNNTYLQTPSTPTSLFAADYTFHAGGALLFRGHFTATGHETTLTLQTQGGVGFASLVWLNDTFQTDAAWAGNSTAAFKRATWPVRLVAGGAICNGLVGGDEMKAPRGIMDYRFGMGGGGGGGGGEAPEVEWRVTGNLGGEDYRDEVRGPLNEGGLFAERMGYHQPGVPEGEGGFVKGRSPLDGIEEPGVGFWTAEMVLDIPGERWDVPLSFEFPGIDAGGGSGRYRAVLWVNGFQFGRYISHIGPQTSFPVPEGILNYHGTNTIAIAIWATQPGGARLSSLSLKAGTPVLTGRQPVVNVAAPAWTARPGAY
ncbi:glycoside hydrolase family 35 protein [Chaetomium fimeti]|uniref:beta-galactosidase n=1 Tax=Chaetomium fimeti TaxID=1854472 RepID=A0AAE0HL51_9PEZI|nr:glycoside hydrolase family 35 protein [Chaetomium fimeti]